jgi:hypothetical protein
MEMSEATIVEEEYGKGRTMVRKLKYVSIAIVIALCATAMLYGPAQAPALAQRQPARSESDKAQPATIMVEAFVVEVNLPALDELGVSPIGQPPRNVSVENILACLANHQARVAVGAKEAVLDRASSTVKTTRTTYVKRGDRQQANYNPYDSGTTLSVRATLLPEEMVAIDYSLTCRVFMPRSESEEAPPDTEGWEWGGDVLLRLGKPAIVAATQDRQRGIFLLLTALVQD